MQTRKLGNSGIEVSVVGLGCNNFGGRTDLAGTRAVVHRALDLGVTLFDTADVYGNRGKSEEYLADSLGPRRKDVVLATKFGMPMNSSAKSRDASPAYIKRAVEASLRRLRTDWIDLYQVHRSDPSTPIGDTLRALNDLKQAGKIRAIGCSNYSAAELDEAQSAAARGKLAFFATGQDEYSLLSRGIETDVLPAMERHRLSLLPYFPLASGLLTGKYRRDAPAPTGARLSYSRHHASDFISERNWTMIEKLSGVAERAGATLLQLAFGWLLAKPVVASVIAGATKPEQIEANVAAAERPPSSDAIAESDAITR